MPLPYRVKIFLNLVEVVGVSHWLRRANDCLNSVLTSHSPVSSSCFDCPIRMIINAVLLIGSLRIISVTLGARWLEKQNLQTSLVIGKILQ